jgi:hypothetical protein
VVELTVDLGLAMTAHYARLARFRSSAGASGELGASAGFTGR